MAADILTSSIKLAEAFVPIREEPKPVEEESTLSTQATESITKPTPAPADDEEDSESKSIQRVIERAQKTEEEKQTLVENLEEIDIEVEEED